MLACKVVYQKGSALQLGSFFNTSKYSIFLCCCKSSRYSATYLEVVCHTISQSIIHPAIDFAIRRTVLRIEMDTTPSSPKALQVLTEEKVHASLLTIIDLRNTLSSCSDYR
ncbi:hypothetical protein HNY73_001426 [Argiope bruennichi]|uniref:Uncharacterized protein n=1 Tax=Argiope bruennichi TaxID=94029 RepID=A0A8T0G790_ARGBR|nr:hypothetical protein HNY73_001426 [Argiope bruennichi]